MLRPPQQYRWCVGISTEPPSRPMFFVHEEDARKAFKSAPAYPGWPVVLYLFLDGQWQLMDRRPDPADG